MRGHGPNGAEDDVRAFADAERHDRLHVEQRADVHVDLGFTASVDAELRPGGVTDSVLVTGMPLIDLASTEVTAHFDSDKVAALPGARDIFAVLASTPGVAVAKIDVGGNGALAVQESTIGRVAERAATALRGRWARSC